MKALILTTRQNHVWTSMQEIIPSLEILWSGIEGIDSEVINIDELNLKNFLPKVLNADKFIVTAFNLKMTRAIEVVRKSVQHKGQIFFYVHNMATIGAWPLERWGLNKYLNSGDRFIVTSDHDLESMKLCYSNAAVIKHPFFFPSYNIQREREVANDPDPDFIFIGRISTQKNLHNLIWAFSKYREKKNAKGKLIFFGEEDHLGSPNMKILGENYLEQLKSFVDKLNLSKQVQFRGFVEREKIESELKFKDYVFISPSLHSDENFGMAAFRALVNGKRAILSDWGGHSDYHLSFASQLELIPVSSSANGPVVSADQILHSMLNILGKKCSEPFYPDYYKMESIRNILRSELFLESSEKRPLVQSKESLELCKRQALLQNNFSMNIFTDYSDPLSHKFFKAYGMEKVGESKLFDRNVYKLSPWSYIRGNQIIIEDPHKGSYFLDFQKGEFPIHDFNGTREYICKQSLKVLVESGEAIISHLDLSTERYEEDLCSTSISILKDKVSSFLDERKVKNIYFADSNNNSFDSDKKVNVVLFGGYLNRILESGCWDFKEMHFWVLSKSVKDVLTNLFNINSRTISIIERSDLFPLKKLSKVNLEEGTDLVYAGRISRVKNIELLIHTVFHLQKILNKNLKLNIIGEYDEIYHDYWGYFSPQLNYKDEVNNLINSLNWKFDKPIFHQKTKPSEWMKKNFKNPHYISLSTYLCEDFSVSVAQAQELGWPCVLSSWGAHRDVINSLQISPNLILPFKRKNIFTYSFGEIIAKEIIKNETYLDLFDNGELERDTLLIEELDLARRDFIRMYGMDVINLIKGGNFSFSQSEKSEKLYEEIFLQLGDFRERDSILILQDGVNESSSLSSHNVERISGINELGSYIFLTASEVLKKKNIAKIMFAKKIIVSFPRKGCEELVGLINNIVVDKSVLTFLEDDYV